MSVLKNLFLYNLSNVIVDFAPEKNVVVVLIKHKNLISNTKKETMTGSAVVK